jgi:hypothetical protein
MQTGQFGPLAQEVPLESANRSQVGGRVEATHTVRLYGFEGGRDGLWFRRYGGMMGAHESCNLSESMSGRVNRNMDPVPSFDSVTN